jgi:hypothetical protein
MTSSVVFSRVAPRVLGALCATLAAGSVSAQVTDPAPNLLDDRWLVSVGAFVLGTQLRGSLNGQAVDNPAIDFDETFGSANDETRVRADVLWRITPAHHLRFMYFNITIDRSNVIDEDVRWGDYTFQSGGKVDFRQKLETIKLSYEYAFLRGPANEVSASVGVHYTSLNLRLAGAAAITESNGQVSNVSSATKTSTVPAPLPVVGLHAMWMLAPQWYLDAQGQFFRVSVGPYDGHWSDLRLGATWMFSRHIGIGLGYNRFETHIGVEKDSFDGRLKMGYSGLQAVLTASF